jgi:hypothetical protein
MRWHAAYNEVPSARRRGRWIAAGAIGPCCRESARIMSLVVFRSKAAGEIFMFAETSRRILEIIGREDAPRGVITAEQVPAALQRLVSAVEQEKADAKAAAAAAEQADRRSEPTDTPQPITLGQRAYPLIEMLRAAERRKVDVTWGV